MVALAHPAHHAIIQEKIALMLTYEVTLVVEEEWREAVADYMRHRHIPDIFDTGCFIGITFEEEEAGRFRTRFQARAKVELNRYLDDFAPDFRADFLEHFPTGVSVTRSIWWQLGEWK